MPEKISESIRKINKNKKFEKLVFEEKELNDLEYEISPQKMEKAIEKLIKKTKDIICLLLPQNASNSGISKINPPKTETEKEIYDAIVFATGGDGKKIEWLMDELGIDFEALDNESDDIFGPEDLTLTPEDQKKVFQEFEDMRQKEYNNLPIQQQMALDSMRYVGNRYEFGSYVGENKNNSTDCSGLVYGILKEKGINVARTANEQYKDSEILHDPRNSINNDSIGEMGDLIFTRHGQKAMINHVRIILKSLGEGKYLVVHAPQTKERVKPVLMNLRDPKFQKNFVIGRLQDLPDVITHINSSEDSEKSS